MKRFIVSTALVLIIVSTVFAEYPPTGWTDSITEGIAQAQREDKMLMLDFTGSDWCVWCKKLEAEVWSKKVFKNWSEDNVVKVFIDFPQGFTLNENQMKQNQILQQMFGVQGFPTIWLLDSNLKPLLRTGYREGGAAEYIRHLEEDHIEVDAQSAEEFSRSVRGGIEEYIGPIPE